MGAPQNTITYGSFSFPFARLSTNTGTIYAEDGFTKVGVRYLVTVSGWIGGVSQADLQSKISNMQANLRKPRGTFIVTWSDGGSTELFHFFNEAVSQDSPGQDIDWGPKPGELVINRFTGGRIATYSWTLSVNVIEQLLTSDVLAVTWQFSHTVDASGFTTRTVSGKILIEGGTVQAGQSADHYRAIVANAIPSLTWYKFESAQY